MRLATTRFKITPKEYALLKPGLDMLANRLATAQMGSYPFRHRWHRIDYVKSNIYQHQAFNQTMAERILEVRRKVWNVTTTRKVRMDALELAAAILALRLYDPARRGFSDIEGAQPLARKLEMLRRRAMRAAKAKSGRAEYRAQAEIWRRFLAWVRYNLLHFRSETGLTVSRSAVPFLMKHWAEQRSQLATMVAAALEKRCYAPLPSSQMDRMVRLLKEGFRRGRYPYTLKELLTANDEAGQEFLFKAVSKKIELTALAGADVPRVVRALESAERFRESRRLRRSAGGVTPSTPAPTVSHPRTSVEGPDDLLTSSRALSNKELAESVALWLETYVDKKHWEHVGTVIVTATAAHPPARVTVPPARTLGELMQKARPRELDWYALENHVLVAYMGQWALTWLGHYRDQYGEIASILCEGYFKAIRRNPLPKTA